ncbi:HAD hydrolase family protein [Anaeromyxobacter oryzae]|uniref:Phosphoglycolate phosphatase n=1 Tax=Anaeromyxobacter oryzae TaxID=2918170 RepID=A0ABN6MUY5_9BACT|nr:HAD hydrolase family protein [Anaeromyxobacter oryzae]BDG04797.1 phosphoglycolate phosphatase [Anaeromyxobacter oryzae]
MRYHALATDYDGTLAASGRVSDRAVAALEKLRSSGRRAVLVTGRQLGDLSSVFSRVDVFDCVVAENGGVLYWPASRETSLQAAPAPAPFADALRARGITHDLGQVIVSSWHPHETAILQVIRELGLELQIVFNGDAVMVLPPGVNKAAGLETALRRLGLSRHEVVAIGNDANDHGMLQLAECGVAVASAVASLRARAAFTTDGGAGEGVVELIEELVRDDLRARSTAVAHDSLLLGRSPGGDEVTIPAYGDNILVAGTSGAGKSTFATGFLERLIEKGYQVCIIDPEGDYSTLEDIVTLGSRVRAPHIAEILDVLSEPATNLVVNLLGIALADRPAFFAELVPRLQSMRARTGRPHWIVIDEAHHLWPASWGLVPSTVPQGLGETVLVTLHPAELARPLVAMIDIAVAVGPRAAETLAAVAAGRERSAPPMPATRLRRGEVVAWFLGREEDPVLLETVPARSARLRHLRKYAEGNLGPHAFVFRGPDGRLRLRAQNLIAFTEIGDGVDDETWLYHLHGGHYSRWIRHVVKDQDLASEIAGMEQAGDLSAAESRRLVRDAIERRYTLPG